MSIPYKELSPEMKRAVDRVLDHRREIRQSVKERVKPSAAIVIPVSLVTYGVHALIKNKPPSGWAWLMHVMGIAGAFTYGMFLDHNRGFRKEYLGLFSALRDTSANSALGKLLQEPGTNYIVINRKGDIIARRFAPRLFGLPIGRRAAINPRAPKRKIEQWKKRHLHVRR